MMELEEMKKTWDDLSAELATQKKLTNDIIIKMAHEKSKNGLNKLVMVETFGGIAMCVVLVLGVLFFMLNGTLGSWQLNLSGFLSICIFMLSGYFSYNFIRKMKKINLLEDTLEETRRNYAEFQKVSVSYKKLGFYTIPPTIIFFLPVVLQVFSHKDIYTDFSDAKAKLIETAVASILVSIPVLFIVLRYYKKNMKATSEAMKDAGIN